jgi:NOL1/NOP2/fmu family ribosome biogenesis protein
MLLGEETPSGFLPSHSWVSRFGATCSRNCLQLNEKQSEAWIEGKNLEEKVEFETERFPFRLILNSEGIPIGRARITTQGLKNLFPHGLK